MNLALMKAEASKLGISLPEYEERLSLNIGIMESITTDESTIFTVLTTIKPKDSFIRFLRYRASNAIGLIFSKFLTIYDISRLDIAYCKNDAREELLDILSSKQLVTYDHIRLDNRQHIKQLLHGLY